MSASAGIMIDANVHASGPRDCYISATGKDDLGQRCSSIRNVGSNFRNATEVGVVPCLNFEHALVVRGMLYDTAIALGAEPVVRSITDRGCNSYLVVRTTRSVAEQVVRAVWAILWGARP